MSSNLFTFLPPVADSETLYSICSALHHLRGGTSWQQSGLFFFNDKRAASHRHFPGNIDHFCEVTQNLFGTPESILSDRTLVGFHARFMNHQAAKDFMLEARGPRDNKVKFPNPDIRKLRLCVKCVIEDRVSLGRGTWRLEHHFPGAKVCMHHGLYLQEVASSDADRCRSWLRPDEFVEKTAEVLPFSFTSEQESWACLAQILWVLKSHERISPATLHQILAFKLANIKVIPAARFLNSKAVEKWLQKEHLPFFDSDLKSLRGQWLKFLDGRGAHQPLRWAVLFAACMGPSEFNLALAKAYSLQSTLDGRWEVSGQGHQDLLPHHVWDLLLDGVSIQEVYKSWRINAVAVNRALRLNPDLKALRDLKIRNDVLMPKRDWVCDFLKKNPNASRADLRKENYASFRWLDTNDKEWLWIQVPPTKAGRWPQKLLFKETSSTLDTN